MSWNSVYLVVRTGGLYYHCWASPKIYNVVHSIEAAERKQNKLVGMLVAKTMHSTYGPLLLPKGSPTRPLGAATTIVGTPIAIGTSSWDPYKQKIVEHTAAVISVIRLDIETSPLEILAEQAE